MRDGHLEARRIRTGIADNTHTVVLEGLTEGSIRWVTGVTIQQTAATSSLRNPLVPNVGERGRRGA